VILRRIVSEDLVDGNEPVLYYNRDPYTDAHHRYELGRLQALAEVLQVDPRRCSELVEFVIPLFCYKAEHLRGLRARLVELYGSDPWATLLAGRPDTPEQRQLFGEWTLYALYLLDHLGLEVPVRNSNSAYLREIHRQHDLDRDPLDARIVHFVDKNFEVADIELRLAQRGLGLVGSPRLGTSEGKEGSRHEAFL
jgi:hypothetical protein